MSFVPAETLSQLRTLNQSTIDALPFGVVKLEGNGKILLYNKYESELGNVPIAQALGKNFFTEVAPCSNNRLFRGRFEAGVAAGKLNELFGYTFTYRMAPTNVEVHMLHDAPSGTNWLFVRRK